MEILHFLSEFVQSFVSSPYASGFLFLVAFIEASFFPIPPDTLLIPLSIANPTKALFYALIATLASTTGGIFGYWLGLKGGRPVLNRFVNAEKMKVVKHYYNRYDIWAIGLAAFTPVPYKVFTISAGVFGIDFKRFLLASLIGRGARFFLVGTLIFIFGTAIQKFLDQYLELVVIGFTVLLVGGFFAFRFFGKRAMKKSTEVQEDAKISSKGQ
ncbi:cytochrome B [Candidatus Woesebacteria bacterium]|nr:cytochrome B [Candidatus Woesebacteria bacterium]